MRYHQLSVDGAQRLAVTRDGETVDLTAATADLRSLRDLLQAAGAAETTIDEIARRHADEAEPLAEETVRDHRTTPVDAGEVWAAGVTYQISEEAREEESGMPEMYYDVYDADRPEVFFKATPSRTVGPDEAVGVRGDSAWDVPEPELGIVLHEGEIVGYTVGNDMSSRSIEGENPLYLPQAKVYDRCCAIGPSVVSAASVPDPHDLDMSMSITRDGEVLYEDQTTTGEMVRDCEELVSYLTRHNAVPELCVLLTGTSLVPEDDFTLQAGDEVAINIEDIGTLSNPVTTV